MAPDTGSERIAELEADNARLRRLLGQRDAPGELRHRLRNTLALLRAIIKGSCHVGRDFPDFVAHLEDRLDSVTRAQALADQYGEIDLRTLVANEFFQYGISEGERLASSGTNVCLQPRAGQMLALAIHELVVNAVEFGALGGMSGHVNVAWEILHTEPHTTLLFQWTEALVPSRLSSRRGFGTEVLTRMLPYELNAVTNLTIELAKVQCTISMPLSKQIGRVRPD